jgi:diguanylate cyclase (GGDEF)-like protein
MAKIFYCCDKKNSRKIILPFSCDKVHTIKGLDSKGCSVIVFDEQFLKRRKSIHAIKFGDSVCLIHFRGDSRPKLSLVKKLGFFDYISDDDTKRDVNFKIQRALESHETRRRIVNLEVHLLEKNKRIEKITLVDPLTNCFNWRYFLKAIVAEVNRSRRHLYSVSFIGIDIDHFRQINELYGVNVADGFTKEFVKLLEGVLRKEDILSRWRSDEFFIIMPHLRNADAYRVAKRIREAISEYTFKLNSIKLRVKASMGVVSTPEDNIFNSRDIISALDKCINAGKRRGGDAIVLFSESHLKPIRAKKSKVNLSDLRVKIDKMNMMLTRDLLEMIYGFARAIEAKDFYTGRHVEMTAAIAEEIAKRLRLPPSEVENIKHAAVLHDLGKVGIDKAILSKKGPLNNRERELIKTHPGIAAEILREIHALRGAVPAVLYHHEYYDGTGYPLGLKGEEIPLSARIVAVADVYQALTSDRPYRKGFSSKQALQIIKKETGTHFDPKIVQIFLKVITSIDGKK